MNAETALIDLSDVRAAPHSHRVLTGDRPTGALHLGHLFGTLESRVQLQGLGAELYVVVADYQVITDRDLMGDVRRNVLGLVTDYLAVGLDAEATTIFAHSAVPALNQLMLPFLSLVTVAELRRNPTVKAELFASGDRAMSALLLTYPVHQAADILFCRGNTVPVGRDQLPHLELARDVARRFNARYCSDRPLFPEPRALLGEAPVLRGLDGQKMSKSRGNAIELGLGPDETAALVRKAKTDSTRHITYDPERRPEVAAMLDTAALCLGEDPRDVAERLGSGGATALKGVLTEAVNERLRSIRKRRTDLVKDPALVLEVLRRGNLRANEIAESTLAQVRSAMGTDYS